MITNIFKIETQKSPSSPKIGNENKNFDFFRKGYCKQ